MILIQNQLQDHLSVLHEMATAWRIMEVWVGKQRLGFIYDSWFMISLRLGTA